MSLRATLCTILAASLMLVTGARAQDAPEPIFELHSAGLEGWAHSSKDNGLMNAIGRLGGRLDELGDELDWDDDQRSAAALAWDLVSSRLSIRVFGPDENNPPRLALTVLPSGRTSQELYQSVIDNAMASGLPLDRVGESNATLSGPMGPITIAHDPTGLTVLMGTDERVEYASASDMLPKGASPLISGLIDPNALVTMFAP